MPRLHDLQPFAMGELHKAGSRKVLAYSLVPLPRIRSNLHRPGRGALLHCALCVPAAVSLAHYPRVKDFSANYGSDVVIVMIVIIVIKLFQGRRDT